jgi:putative pre-16S rRNA nuclease
LSREVRSGLPAATAAVSLLGRPRLVAPRDRLSIMTPHRAAGLDIGEKRIGVAISDALGITAQPVGVVARTSVDTDVRGILALLGDYDVTTFVAGLPLQMDATEGEQAERVRRFCKRLEAATGIVVAFYDERLTTAESRRLLVESGMRRKQRKQVVDKIAAVLILQGWLDSGGSAGRLA